MRQTIRLKESQLKNIIAESVKRILNEGIYDYPDGIDYLILDSENDFDCMQILDNIARMLCKKYDKGVELSTDILANSSALKKYQQFVFRKFKYDQADMPRIAPRMFREYVADKLIEKVQNGEYSFSKR